MALNGTASKGVKYFQEGKYEDALKTFDQAIRENSNDKNLFDSRAAVLEKLDRVADALKDAKKVIDLAPNSWQGYRRAARLFLRLGRHSVSLKMVDMSLERMKAADTKRRAELETLREDILEATKQSECHFAKLPVEIQTEIFSLVINGNNARMLALNLVCRHWRNLILDTPKFWRRLVLERESPQTKADAWLERANGVLTSLRIESGFELHTRHNVFRTASKDLWLKLEELEVDVKSFEVLLSEVIPQLKLRKFVLDSESTFVRLDLWKELGRLEMSGVRHFAMKINKGAVLLDKLTFCGLTTLELSGIFEYRHFFDLLRRNTSLEVLIIIHPTSWSVLPPAAEPVELPHLRRLELSNMFSPNIFLRYLRTPSVAIIKVDSLGRYYDLPCIQTGVSQDVTNLTEVVLSRCVLPCPTLIDLLRRSDSLETLKLGHCLFRDGDVNDVVGALCDRASSERSASIVCPKLQHLEISRSHDLKAGPIVWLVKLHLAASEAPTPDEPTSISSSLGHAQDRTLPLPILSLDIRDCDGIDSDSREWLRARVPTFNGMMTTKEKMRKKLWL